MTAVVRAGILAATLAASTAAAQSPASSAAPVGASGSAYLPPGYVVPASGAVYVAPTMPAQPIEPRTTSIRGLWIPGLVGLPVAWVSTWANAIVALPPGSDGMNAAFIPVAGPWLVLASQSVDVGYYVTAGVFQDLSLLCLVLGLAIRVPEPSARFALGDATLDLAAAPTASGGRFSASIQF
jgi:hypothetical protein